MDKTRTELLLGCDAVLKLSKSHVAVFGVGGVGGFSAEALARAGVGKITLVDSDKVSPSNINRQIIALTSTVGMPKVEVMKKRIEDINPDAQIITHELLYSEKTRDTFDFASYDYVVDAIDSVESKLDLILTAKAAGVPIISAMGAGKKLDPTRFRVADIKKTAVCPLARAVRTRLRQKGIPSLKVVFSDELPVPTPKDAPKLSPEEHAPGSISFVPSVVGLILAGEVIKDISHPVTDEHTREA